MRKRVAIYTPGTTHGKFTVIGTTHTRMKVLVRCVCGKEKEMYKSNIKRNKDRPCSCLERKARQAVMVGQRYGKLTIIAPAVAPKPTTRKRFWWHCECDCGKATVHDGEGIRSGKIRSCGCLRKETTAQRNRVNNKGWTHKRTGYRYLSVDGRPVVEHRYIMEQHIGRKLYDHETVHHINGVRDDNRMENLELWSHSQPKGQRVTDKVNWAIQFLWEEAPHVLKRGIKPPSNTID